MNLKKYENYINHVMPWQKMWDFRNKEYCLNVKIQYLLNKTQSMFKWENLPDTIPERNLELFLQTNGHCAICLYDGKPYAFFGSLGGEPDEYYRATVYTVANPYFNFNKNLKIDEECVVIPNDSLYMGLVPLFRKYCSEIVETDISIFLQTICLRSINFISAPDDDTQKSAEIYVEKIEKGEISVIAENAFLDGVRIQPGITTGGNQSLLNFIELLQYQKANLLHEIGLNSNFNMKREALNSAESALNDDALSPLVDDMLKMRKLFAKKANEKYGLNMRVSFDSSWKDNEKEIDLELSKLNKKESEPKVSD